ncbi:MAG: glycosyltransferase family 9 protein [Planctomycetes bacterium]|nr:glycosyltransferase family 9 protein [Planctomycetota bacterium]
MADPAAATVHRLLVVRRGGLGDTLLMLPVLRALRRAHPAAALHFAGVREFAAVLADHGACDRVRSSEDLALWSAARARQRLADYDLVVADEPSVRDAARAARVFDPQPAGDAPLGQQLARQLGLALQWPADAWLCARRTAPADGAIVLAPGSGGAAKCWPRPRWLALAAALPQPPHVLVGPTEIERDDPRCWPWPVAPTFVVEPEPVVVARRLAVTARAFVGNDSGPTHLAAMLGVPTVALFGPSDARVFAPQGPCCRVLVAAGASGDLSAASVAGTLRGLLAGTCAAPAEPGARS